MKPDWWQMKQNVDLDVQARGKPERQRYREWKEGHGEPKGVRLKWTVPVSKRVRPLKAENPKDVAGMKQAQQIQQDGAKRAKNPLCWLCQIAQANGHLHR